VKVTHSSISSQTGKSRKKPRFWQKPAKIAYENSSSQNQYEVNNMSENTRRIVSNQEIGTVNLERSFVVSGHKITFEDGTELVILLNQALHLWLNLPRTKSLIHFCPKNNMIAEKLKPLISPSNPMLFRFC
jgi:hypothetical protein